MSKNTSKIKACLKRLLANTDEIVSGTVTAISDNGTISVLITGHETPIENVRLNSVIDNDNGWLIYPELNSNVVIACIDGPGEYTLIRASNISKAVIKINDQVLTMDGSKYGLVKGGESMGKIMSDLMDKILAMTFTNGAGTTSIANNSTDLSQIKNRITNFLTT